MTKHINLELFKQNLIKELNDLSPEEMEDVLKYILLVKKTRNMKIRESSSKGGHIHVRDNGKSYQWGTIPILLPNV